MQNGKPPLSLEIRLARWTVALVLAAAAVMVIGLASYLTVYGGRAEGDKVFTGEPAFLRDPVAMLATALHPGETGQRRSLIQIGVLLLLLSPVVRVVFAGAGFVAEKDLLYVVLTCVVLAVLAFSFFW